MITSRHDPSLGSLLSLEIRASGEDIREYVRGHIRDLAKFVSGSPDLQEAIANSVVAAADGMYICLLLVEPL